MTWPNDADGDVMRRLEASGFDFDHPCTIDFEVDFIAWPPAEEAIELLRREYSSVVIYGPSDEDEGHVQLQIFDRLRYDLVIRVQDDVTGLMAPFGGVCEAWGVLH